MHIDEHSSHFLSRQRFWIGVMAGMVALLVFLYLRFVLLSDIDNDEVEHAHVGFRLLEGLLPYRDFYQNHLPAYWLATRQFVELFPLSMNAILAGRAVAALALFGSSLFGLLMLRQFRGGKTWLALLIYSWVVILFAYPAQFFVARPDPIMTLFATAGLCLIPARGNLSGSRALVLGFLFGVSASLTPKVAPLMLVVPALVFFHCVRDRSVRPGFAWITYGLGALLGLLPTVVWLLSEGLMEAFIFDIFGINLDHAKPWRESFMVLRSPVYLPAILGSLSWLAIYKNRANHDRNGPLVLALALAAGLVLSIISKHLNLYNLQALAIPVAIGFSRLVVVLWLRTKGLGYRLIVVAALLGYPTAQVGMSLTSLVSNGIQIEQSQLQQVIDLARPGGRSCLAFAPYHPIFCHDVSELSLQFDLHFASAMRDPRQIERFRRIWQEGIQKTLEHPPDIIVRTHPARMWEGAVKHGLVSEEDLAALDRLRPGYSVKRIGWANVWSRP